MFVRWKRRKLSARPWEQPEYSLYAVLVESHRVGGKPRQKVVQHLGYIHEHGLAPGYTAHRVTFWERVDKNLAVLNLASDVLVSVERELSAKVPRPSQEEITQIEKELTAFRSKLAEITAGRGVGGRKRRQT